MQLPIETYKVDVSGSGVLFLGNDNFVSHRRIKTNIGLSDALLRTIREMMTYVMIYTSVFGNFNRNATDNTHCARILSREQNSAYTRIKSKRRTK